MDGFLLHNLTHPAPGNQKKGLQPAADRLDGFGYNDSNNVSASFHRRWLEELQ